MNIVARCGAHGDRCMRCGQGQRPLFQHPTSGAWWCMPCVKAWADHTSQVQP